MRRFLLACSILLAAAVFFACGGDGDGDDGPAVTPITRTTVPTQAGMTPPITVEPTETGPTTTAAPTDTPEPTTFKVHFIDVDQGDAILIETDDTDILVDGGPSGSGVLACLSGQNVPDIDLLVATQPHADHIGGLDDVLAQYSVLEVWTNGATATTQAYQDFVAAVAAEGAVEREARRGDSTPFGSVTLTVLHPTDSLSGDTNTNSVVLRLSCGSVDVLLTGDATEDSEASMLALGGAAWYARRRWARPPRP